MPSRSGAASPTRTTIEGVETTTIDRREIEAGAVMARKALGKDRALSISGRTPMREERLRAWSAQGDKDRVAAPPAERAALETTRRDLHTPGGHYTVGAERYAAGGTIWKRTG